MRLLAIPALRDNLIWLGANADGEAFAVDPGDDAPVEAALAAHCLRLSAILLTHHHNDHIGGAEALMRRHGATVYAPPDERIALEATRVADGDRFVAAGFAFDVLDIPAHTRSHIAFVGDNAVFCGDTLFSLGCGRLFEGSPEQLHVALQKLASLPERMLVCCGHEYTVANARFAQEVEPNNAERDAWMAVVHERLAAGNSSLPSTIGIERAANPFLRVDSPAVRGVLAQRGDDATSAVARLAALRHWKDGFA